MLVYICLYELIYNTLSYNIIIYSIYSIIYSIYSTILRLFNDSITLNSS